MRMETQRLILRPWLVSDATDLYACAKDPAVGPAAGWPVHTDVENSRQIIRDVLSGPGIFAVVLKSSGRAVGSVGITVGERTNLKLPDTEGELGYWLGQSWWGQGLIPEAAERMLRYGFEDLRLQKIWCSCFEENVRSRRVQEKCGFFYQRTAKTKWGGQERVERISCMSLLQWKERRI